ncbi:ACT domain-containing protein ACR3-like, partial [Capsicum annuum]|uniref:ACT domain-containing protein ACR3-like n=1 Tax=Capsicum annuum TaxID=4072 RepID=UPI001FB08397
MARSYGPYFDPEYETLSIRINPPRVSVDNASSKDCTLVKVDSINKPGILLEVVQILTDLDFVITKAYISSNDGWFMDVFHITDQHGNKVTDNNTIGHIEKALGSEGYTSANLHFNVTAAEVWNHNRRIACVLYINDNCSSLDEDEESRLCVMEEQLNNILRGREDDESGTHATFSV